MGKWKIFMICLMVLALLDISLLSCGDDGAKKYDLTISINPAGGGNTDPGAGTYTYVDGDEVTITATAASGYEFDHWSGDATGVTASVNVTMTADMSVYANFNINYSNQLDYPTNRWQRIWSDHDFNYLGHGPDEEGEQFDNNWGTGVLAYERSNYIICSSSRKIYLPFGGLYRFAIGSNDASSLYIDGSLIIDNGGEHPYQEACAYAQLSAGYHNFKINYHEYTGDARLSFSYSGSNTKRIACPTTGFPAIQIQNETEGSTFTITIAADPGLSTNPSDWNAEIKKGYRHISTEGETTCDNGTDYYLVYDLDINNVNLLGDTGQSDWYSLEVEIPSASQYMTVINGLYDLEVQDSNSNDYTAANSVQIIDSFSSQPTFCILSDSHIGFSGRPGLPEWVPGEWHEVVPDINEINIFAEEIEEINLIHPDFIIITGDMVDWSCQNNWEDFNNLLKLFEVPVYTIVGNHDYYKNAWWGDSITDVLLSLNNSRSNLVEINYYFQNINPNLNYTFDYGPFHMVCLDSGYDAEIEASGSGLEDCQIDWLQNDLNSHSDSLIFMHHPAVSTNDDECITNNVDNFKNLCRNRNVMAVFSGHTHRNNYIYEDIDYYWTTSATQSSLNNGYRIVKLTSLQNYETVPLWANRFSLEYSPVNWNAGSENTVTATIENRHAEEGYDLSSTLFPDMFLKFIMPAGEYEVSAVTAPSVWTQKPEVADCEILANIVYGDKSLIYVNVDVRDAELTQFPSYQEYLTNVEVTLSSISSGDGIVMNIF